MVIGFVNSRSSVQSRPLAPYYLPDNKKLKAILAVALRLFLFSKIRMSLHIYAENMQRFNSTIFLREGQGGEELYGV